MNEKEKNYHVRLQLFLGESKSSLTAYNHCIIALDYHGNGQLNTDTI
jgi:hypothetical protein